MNNLNKKLSDKLIQELDANGDQQISNEIEDLQVKIDNIQYLFEDENNAIKSLQTDLDNSTNKLTNALEIINKSAGKIDLNKI